MENDKPKPVPQDDLAFPETVCHRVLTADLVYVPKAEYQGRTVYFCTEVCLNTFLSDPERFYPAHSRKRVNSLKYEFNAEEKG